MSSQKKSDARTNWAESCRVDCELCGGDMILAGEKIRIRIVDQEDTPRMST